VAELVRREARRTPRTVDVNPFNGLDDLVEIRCGGDQSRVVFSLSAGRRIVVVCVIYRANRYPLGIVRRQNVPQSVAE
jgi:hypothetical protein